MDPRRLRAAALLVLLALTAAAVPAAGAASRPAIVVEGGVTQPAFSYKKAIRETVYVQSTIDDDLDGDLDLLATDIIRPQETEAGLTVPVIYEMSPYYQSLGRGNESEVKNEEDGDFVPDRFPLFYDNYFVPRGYAVVLQDMRGTRNSEGCMELGGAGELIDAEATVDWLNGRGAAFTADGQPVDAEWSTGQVGMIGKSYDGSIANGAASTGVEGLETIVPIAAISRWYDYHLNNGVQYLNAYITPANFTFMIDQDPGDDEERGLEWYEATFTENSTCSARGAEIVAKAANPVADYDAFWDERDYLKDVDNVTASVFLVHGLNDYNVKPNNFVHWWQALAKRDVPRKIWLAQVAHVDPFDFRRDEWVTTLHRWFDYWLHDIDNGIMDEPMLDIEREDGTWTTEPTWPQRAARAVRLYFSADRNGSLTRKAADGTKLSFTDDPFQSEQSMIANPGTPDGSRLLFLSGRLRRSLRISGRTVVEFQAEVDRPDTNFTALLVDYGTARRIEPEVTTTGKESCHGESTPVDDACYLITKEQSAADDVEIVTRGWLDARHRDDPRSGSPLVGRSVYPFRWELFGDDYLFRKGHRIGVAIAGSDRTYTVPDPSGATITMWIGKASVWLPIVGGTAAARRSGI